MQAYAGGCAHRGRTGVLSHPHRDATPHDAPGALLRGGIYGSSPEVKPCGLNDPGKSPVLDLNLELAMVTHIAKL